MKKLAIAFTILCCASMANAGVIYDIQVGGLYTPGDIVTTEGVVVTAVAYNGVWVAECTNQPGEGIWVYLGSGHPFVVGDIIIITADYKEYYDLSELDAGNWEADPPLEDAITFVCADQPVAPIDVTVTEIMANAELYEGNVVRLTDGFGVHQFLSYGEWIANSFDGAGPVHFDDVMFDETVLSIGSCYNMVTGAWHYSFGNYKMLPTADGLIPVECAVPTQEMSFGAIKALYR